MATPILTAATFCQIPGDAKGSVGTQCLNFATPRLTAAPGFFLPTGSLKKELPQACGRPGEGWKQVSRAVLLHSHLVVMTLCSTSHTRQMPDSAVLVGTARTVLATEGS